MKFDKPTLVTLTAPTCSGKSHLLRVLERNGFSRIVGTTTRPPRDGEVQGVDYDFLSDEQSSFLEGSGAFAELITFRGVRYGVTHKEMELKMTGEKPPVVILEPEGLKIYEQYCIEHGWEIFKIYVSTQESIRIDRLNQRTFGDALKVTSPSGVDKEAFSKIIKAHTDRLLSITGDERRWGNLNKWDVLVPGTMDEETTINYIEKAIKWRNSRNAQLNT